MDYMIKKWQGFYKEHNQCNEAHVKICVAIRFSALKALCSSCRLSTIDEFKFGVAYT